MTSPADEDYLWQKRHEIVCKIELSGLYHQKRERFFELCDKLGKTISLIGGSATFWKISEPGAVLWIAAGITVSSAFSLVFSFSERSRRHAELSRNYRQILADIMTKGERDYTEDDLKAWSGKVYTLEATEPPSLAALTILCQNELAIANGDSKSVRKLNFWQRSFANICDLPLHE